MPAIDLLSAGKFIFIILELFFLLFPAPTTEANEILALGAKNHKRKTLILGFSLRVFCAVFFHVLCGKNKNPGRHKDFAQRVQSFSLVAAKNYGKKMLIL